MFNVLDKIHENAIASLTNDTNYKKEKLEKLFILPSENFEAVDFTSMGVINEDSTMLPKFIEGEKYSLQGTSCDGFKMPNKIYELIGVVDEFCGVNVDYVIMKQIEGERSQIYSLSKNDCAYLGIEYQDGLQPFPKNMHWERIKEKVEFINDDLSTTPRSEVDNTIRYILLKLNGFKDYSDGYILSPSGKLIKEEKFEKSLRIINNEPIVYGNGYAVKDKTRLNTKIVYPQGLLYNHANFISQDDTIYVLITLKVGIHANDRKYSSSIDYSFGIEPRYLSNIKPQELFTIKWDELGCLTINEYEAIKEKERQKELEKIKKIEEEKKKKIEIEEKNKIASLKRAKINVPEFPSAPIFRYKTDNIDDSINLYATRMSNYFTSLNEALDILSNSIANGLISTDLLYRGDL